MVVAARILRLQVIEQCAIPDQVARRVFERVREREIEEAEDYRARAQSLLQGVTQHQQLFDAAGSSHGKVDRALGLAEAHARVERWLVEAHADQGISECNGLRFGRLAHSS